MLPVRLRRLMAGPLIVLLALFWMEVAVADVHEEGESPIALSQHGAPPAGPHHSQGNAPTKDGHPVHVCHCTHSHITGWVNAVVEVALSPSHKVPLRLQTAGAIPTPDLQGQDRPPIA